MEFQVMASTIKRTTEDRIASFCRRSGYAVGSHMHGGLFLVSKPIDGERRRWEVAAFDSKNKKVTLTGANAPLKSGAEAALVRKLAEKGQTLATASTVPLNNAPSYPYGLYGSSV
jgi:hypothetical protein